MIIECVNCNKKFNVNSNLIPDEGREIKCGSCNHVWYFNKDDKIINDPNHDHMNHFFNLKNLNMN